MTRLAGIAAGMLVALLLPAAPALAIDLNDADCVIEPHRTVELSTSVDGIVERIFVDRGDLIKKGQVLVRLEAGVERATYEQARLRTQQMSAVELAAGRLAFAKKKRERTMELFADKAVSEFTRDEVNLEVETAELELKSAEENHQRALLDLERAKAVLDLRSIASPLDGVVVERLIAEGEAIGEQQTVVLTLVQIDPLNVELIVPASQFGQVRIGDTLMVAPAFPAEGSYEATIDIIDPVIDASSGTFGIRATLPNPGLRIPAGLNCTAELL